MISANKGVKYFETTLPDGSPAFAYMIVPGQQIDLRGLAYSQTGLFDANGKDVNGNLLFLADGQPATVLWNFSELANHDNPPTFLVGEDELEAKELIELTVPDIAPEAGPEEVMLNLADIEPAAGPAGAPGGAGFNVPDILLNSYATPDEIANPIGANLTNLGPAAGGEEILPPVLTPAAPTPPGPPANNPPVANPDSFTTPEDTALTINAATLLANDTDADGDTLSITNVATTSANGGSVNYNAGTGQIVYTPAANYNGPDSFTYTIRVTVSVSPSGSPSFARTLIVTDVSSAVVATSSRGPGRSFTGVTLMRTVAVSNPPLPSVTS
jgi:hypothetical protein